MSRECPFCGLAVNSLNSIYCPRCYNQILHHPSGDIYSFPETDSYQKLSEVYASIFSPTDPMKRFVEGRKIIGNYFIRVDNFSDLPNDGSKKIAGDALEWAKNLCSWGIYFDNNGEPQNISAASLDVYREIDEIAESLDFGGGIRKAIEHIRTLIGEEEYAVRAKNLCCGCLIRINGESRLDQDSYDTIRAHARQLDRSEPMIFISAPSNDGDTGNRALEYAVAKALKYQLDMKGVRAFWWESFNRDIKILGRETDKREGGLRIAAKIAFGLAFSSIFMGIALGDTENFSQNKNCKYEIREFFSFFESKETAREYVTLNEKEVGQNKDAPKLSKVLTNKLPPKRFLRLLTKMRDHTELSQFANQVELKGLFEGEEEFNVNCSECSSVDAYVARALESIFDILQHNFKTKYNALKMQNNIASDDEFRLWFCTITGDVGAFHEIVNAPTNYNCSYAVLDEYGVDVHEQIEFFVERINYWDFDAKRAKRAIRLNMVVNATNDKYIADKELARNANENNPAVADGCGFLFDDNITYQRCSISFEDVQMPPTTLTMRFSEYTRAGGKWCIVNDVDSLNSGIFGTIKFETDSGSSKIFHFAVSLSRQLSARPKAVEHTHGRLYDSVRRKLRCPYCARPLPYFTQRIKKVISEQGIQCDGNQCDMARFGKRDGMILCDQGIAAPSPAFVLPDNYENSKSAFITMMGLSDTGKSVFISKLFGIEKGEIDFTRDGSIVVESVKLSDEYIQYALAPYVSSVSCYRPEAIATETDIPDASLWEEKFLRSDSDNPQKGIFTSYCSIPYANFVKKTFIPDGETLHYAPLILKLQTHDGLENYFSFYDLPGEEIETIAKRVKTRRTDLETSQIKTIEGMPIKSVLKHIALLQNSNGIILMINVGAHKAEGEKGISDLCEILTSFLSRKKYDSEDDEQKKKKASQYKQVKDVAIAVVLCQFDRLESEFPYDNIVRALAPLEDADFYKHSEMEKYIDACSTELKRFLSGKGYGALIDIIDKFVYHKYFAVSAIGHQDSITSVSRSKNPDTRFISNPRGIDNVLIWLAYQMGMID